MTERDGAINAMLKKANEPQQPILWSDFKTTAEVERAQNQFHYGYPGLSPGSVFVAAIGTTWKPGAWQKTVDMVQHTRDKGYNTWLEEIPDPLIEEPYATLGNMRDTAVMLAQARGFERVCIIENDVLPEPELLVSLIQRDIPIVAPRVMDPAHPGETIGYPDWPAETGLYPMKFVPFSFVLYRTAVFNCIPQAFASIGTEGELFLRLWNYGHRPYQDTDNPLEIASEPSYRQDSYDERIKFLRKADARRRQPPDRAPIDSSTPTIQGIYAPFYPNGKEPVDASA